MSVFSAPAEALAFIVGNSRALWPPFTRFVGERLAEDPAWLQSHPHALDEYTRRVVEAALEGCGVERKRVSVFYSYETLEEQGRAVSVTTAAHVAGLAYYEPTHQRSVHGSLGPWIAYRAIVTFDVDAAPLPGRMPPPPPPADPCTAAEWARVGVLQAECFAKWEGEQGNRADWDRLVEVVGAFETGRAHAYGAEQLAFHYEPDVARRAEHLRRCAQAS